LRKLDLIESENFKELPLERFDSNNYEPNLTGVRSPVGYSPKIK